MLTTIPLKLIVKAVKMIRPAIMKISDSAHRKGERKIGSGYQCNSRSAGDVPHREKPPGTGSDSLTKVFLCERINSARLGFLRAEREAKLNG